MGSTTANILAALSLFLLIGSCGGGDDSRSLDGGYALDWEREDEKELLSDPCWRKEGGGWHRSAGHCHEMLPRTTVTGVWVTGFEESSFFPGATSLPDRNDQRRFRIELEVEPEQIARLVRQKFEGPEPHAVALTFAGRRTKYPVAIDCYGGRTYVFVADTVKQARYLGIMANPDPPPLPPERPFKPFKRSGEGGVVGKMEEEALARCAPRPKGS